MQRERREAEREEGEGSVAMRLSPIVRGPLLLLFCLDDLVRGPPVNTSFTDI